MATWAMTGTVLDTLSAWWKGALGTLGAAGVIALVGLVLSQAARPDEELVRLLRNLAIGVSVVAAGLGLFALIDQESPSAEPQVLEPGRPVATSSGPISVPPPVLDVGARASAATTVGALEPIEHGEANQVIHDFVVAADKKGSESTAWEMLTNDLQSTYSQDGEPGFDRFTEFWQLSVEHVELGDVAPEHDGEFAVDTVYVVFLNGEGQGPTCRQRQQDQYGLARQPNGRVLIDSYSWNILDSC